MFAIIHLGIHWWLAWRSFVVKADTPDDALETYINQPEWLAALSVTSFYSMGLIADFVTVSSSTIFYQVTIRSGGAGQFGIVTGKLYVFHSCSSSSASVCISIQIYTVLLAYSSPAAFCIMASVFQIDPSNLSLAARKKFARFTAVYFCLSFASTVISTFLTAYRIITIARETDFTLRVLIAKSSKSSSSRLPFIL